MLAVSFLLGISADPNQLDRWNKTPMDDALRGRVLCVCVCVRVCLPETNHMLKHPPSLACLLRVFLSVSAFWFCLRLHPYLYLYEYLCLCLGSSVYACVCACVCLCVYLCVC